MNELLTAFCNLGYLFNRYDIRDKPKVILEFKTVRDKLSFEVQVAADIDKGMYNLTPTRMSKLNTIMGIAFEIATRERLAPERFRATYDASFYDASSRGPDWRFQ